MKNQNIRIQKQANGKFYIEQLKYGTLPHRNNKWVNLVFYAGTEEPFGYLSYDHAVKDLLVELKYQILSNSSIESILVESGSINGNTDKEMEYKIPLKRKKRPSQTEILCKMLKSKEKEAKWLSIELNVAIFIIALLSFTLIYKT